MPSTTRPRDRRLATLLGGAALVGATATMAVAAQTSLPGESLYGVKRGIESAQVRLAGDDAARGRTLLAQAETRLTELEELAAGTGGAEQLIPDTLDAFTEQSGEGVRSLLTSYGSRRVRRRTSRSARAFTSTSMDRLDALQGDAARAARATSCSPPVARLTDLDTEISTACGLCDGALTTTPDFLLSQRGDPTSSRASTSTSSPSRPRPRSRARTSPASPSPRRSSRPAAAPRPVGHADAGRADDRRRCRP